MEFFNGFGLIDVPAVLLLIFVMLVLMDRIKVSNKVKMLTIALAPIGALVYVIGYVMFTGIHVLAFTAAAFTIAFNIRAYYGGKKGDYMAMFALILMAVLTVIM